MRKIFLLLICCVLIVGPIVFFVPQKVEAQAALKLLTEVEESFSRAFTKKAGVKLTVIEGGRGKKVQEEISSGFFKEISNLPRATFENFDAMIAQARPVPTRPGWLKVVVGTALLVTGLDIVADIHNWATSSNTYERVLPPVDYANPELIIEAYGNYFRADTDGTMQLVQYNDHVFSNPVGLYDFYMANNHYLYQPYEDSGNLRIRVLERNYIGDFVYQPGYSPMTDFYQMPHTGYNPSTRTITLPHTVTPWEYVLVPNALPVSPFLVPIEIEFPDPAHFPNWRDLIEVDPQLEPNVAPKEVTDPYVNPDTGLAPEPLPQADPNYRPDLQPAPEIAPVPLPHPVSPEPGGKQINMQPLLQVGQDLTTKFPFSIPWDLGRQLSVFDADPVAPFFAVDIPQFFKFGSVIIPLKFDVDFQMFDLVAQICRWGTVLLFDIGIILGIRRLLPE